MQTSDQARTHPARPGDRRRTGPAQCSELAALEMASTMSVGMVAWMRYRRHGRASTLEMARAMFAPAVAPIPLLLLEHLAMFVLMFVVMLRRRAEYGGAAHG